MRIILLCLLFVLSGSSFLLNHHQFDHVVINKGHWLVTHRVKAKNLVQCSSMCVNYKAEECNAFAYHHGFQENNCEFGMIDMNKQPASEDDSIKAFTMVTPSSTTTSDTTTSGATTTTTTSAVMTSEVTTVTTSSTLTTPIAAPATSEIPTIITTTEPTSLATTTTATSTTVTTTVSGYSNEGKIFRLVTKDNMDKVNATEKCARHGCRLPTITSPYEADLINTTMFANKPGEVPIFLGLRRNQEGIGCSGEKCNNLLEWEGNDDKFDSTLFQEVSVNQGCSSDYCFIYQYWINQIRGENVNCNECTLGKLVLCMCDS